MRPTVATCQTCGWHGEIFRHKPDHCARYVRIKKMYLSGMTCRQVAKALDISSEMVSRALKVMRVQARPRGGVNNPRGVNG